MASRAQKMELLRDYAPMIDSGIRFPGNFSDKQLDGAMRSYGGGPDEEVLGLYDCSIFDNGKQGMMFTESAFYFKFTLGGSDRVYYADVTRAYYDKMSFKSIRIVRSNGGEYGIDPPCDNKSALAEYINEMIKLCK